MTISNEATETQVITALTLGFCTDPVMRWLFPDPVTYLNAFPRTLELFGGAAFENGTALLTKDHRAAAMWLPPGAHPDGDGLMAHFEATLAPDVLRDAYKVFERIDELHPTEPCWHLAFVATDPAVRGKGHGSALIDHILPRCDQEGVIAYLENTNLANTGFYRRHGFEVIGEIDAGDAPPMVAMQRDPH